MAHFVRIPTAENLLSSMDSCVILCFFPVGTDLRIFAVINVGIQASFKLKYVAVRKMPSFVGTTYQCDQKAILFFNLLTLVSLKNCQSRCTSLPNTKQNHTKISQRLFKFCQRGEISPNLVTLLPTYLGIVLVA